MRLFRRPTHAELFAQGMVKYERHAQKMCCPYDGSPVRVMPPQPNAAVRVQCVRCGTQFYYDHVLPLSALNEVHA